MLMKRSKVTPRLFQHLLAIIPGNSGNSLFTKAVGEFSPTKGPEDGIKGNWVALDEIKKPGGSRMVYMPSKDKLRKNSREDIETWMMV